jgi:hypothetical protein
MSKNLDGIVAKIREVRKQKRPEVENNLQRIDNLLAAIRATRGRADSVANQYPDLKETLRGISFNPAETLLGKARKACEDALLRLRRESINIGVAGKARQGKSMILQMLTGLGDKQIPTGDGGFCTAVRSIVHNRDAQSATVHYLTEARLLGDKVYPSYEPVGTSDVALGLTSRPSSVAAFLANDLPSIPDTASVEAIENWKKVQALQSDLRANPALVSKLNASPELIPLDSVRDFLVKDKGETNYHIVDYVEIVTPFDADLPKGMTVYDLPGLEDPSPGIRETMLKCVSEEADVVFLLRMPKNTGDDWDAADLRTMTQLKNIYPASEVQPKDWIQLVLNLDKRPASHNEKNVELMNAKSPHGFRPVICDCGSKDKVREMVDANIDALVSQAGRIDDLRIRQADEAFHIALAEANALYNALRNASGDVVAQESGFNFEKKLEKFMSELRDPLKKDQSPAFREMVEEVLARHFKAAKEKFESLYAKNEDADDFPEALPVFSKSRLAVKFGKAEGPAGPVEIAVRNQREAVLKLLRDQLTECCDELVARYFDCVIATGFAPNPALSRIGEVGASDSRARLDNFLAAIRQSGSFASLESAIESLVHFQLTFDGSILPAIYSIDDLDDFNPERVVPEEDARNELEDVKAYITDGVHDSRARAEALFNWMRMKSESILSCITAGSAHSPLFQITEHVANTMRANYDAFVFRFIWGETTEYEWRRFADRNKAVFWKDEFDAAAANSRLAKDWSSALDALRAALA